MGVVGAATWLLLAVLLLGSAIAGEFARRGYEQATGAAYADPIAAVAGPQADGLLDRLRRWELTEASLPAAPQTRAGD
jgi:hypothetical protein